MATPASKTELLSKRVSGNRIDIIGPLGNGFKVQENRKRDKEKNKKERRGEKLKAILIAGGIAEAPLLALAEKLHKSIRKESIVMIGAGTKSHILCKDEFRKLGFKVQISTEDGSMGHKGLATSLLKNELSAKRSSLYAVVYGCGPVAMLREVSRITDAARVHCEISLEGKMGCGTGVCLGCAIKTVMGTKMVCKDGPVFSAGEIVWE